MTEPDEYFAGAPGFVVCDPWTGRLVDAWRVEPSGFAEYDEQQGRAYANAAVAFARTKQNSSFIAFIIAAALHKARCVGVSGIEIGFVDRIATLAYAGAHH